MMTSPLLKMISEAGGMRRRGWNARSAEEHGGEKEKTSTQKVMRLQAYAVAALALLLLTAMMLPADLTLLKPTVPSGEVHTLFDDESEDVIWNTTVAEIATFRKYGKLPTFGLTAGRYYYMAGHLKSNAAIRMKSLCKYDCTNNTKPPLELLRPGRLSDGRPLQERSECFLWYAAQLWTRPMGGKKGLFLLRLGAGVDDKAYLIHALAAYQAKNKCLPFQVAPPTIELNDTRMCHDFFNDNKRWAPSADALWFMKAADGSTGRHISLIRRRDIDRMVAGPFAVPCPVPGGVASLEVADVLLMDGRKFDNRVFILVVSFDPLIVLFHKGHIRRSVLNYSDPEEDKASSVNYKIYNTSFYNTRVFDEKMKQGINKFAEAAAGVQGVQSSASKIRKLTPAPPSNEASKPPPPHATYAVGENPELNTELARHVTNPRFGLAHTNDTASVIEPLDILRQEVLRRSSTHAEKGIEAWKRMERSVRNAALHVTYAIKHKGLGREYQTRWGYMWLAMDVVYDDKYNAFVVDVNSGPSFYHEHKWPRWFVKERSALVREAIDYIQEAAFFKATKHTKRTALTPPKEWELLFHEHRAGAQMKGLISEGECAVARLG